MCVYVCVCVCVCVCVYVCVREKEFNTRQDGKMEINIYC